MIKTTLSMMGRHFGEMSSFAVVKCILVMVLANFIQGKIVFFIFAFFHVITENSKCKRVGSLWPFPWALLIFFKRRALYKEIGRF